MKIAILIYGRLNKAISQYDNIINNIINNNKIEKLDFFASSDNSSNIENFVCKYKPKNYTNDKIIIDENYIKYFKQFVKARETKVENVLKHFINKKRVYNLFKKYLEISNTQYDVILSIRIDIKLSSKFVFQYPKNNTIYIPEGQDWSGGINDQIAYGNLDVMKKYFHIIHNCNFILKNNLSNIGFHPENLTLANIKLFKLNIERFKLQYNIVRDLNYYTYNKESKYLNMFIK